jgi:hypothetical protein
MDAGVILQRVRERIDQLGDIAKNWSEATIDADGRETTNYANERCTASM